MTIEPIVERIDPALEELMDRFFANSSKDLEEMQAVLAAGDFETLARLGHTAKGTGYGYGFRGMGDIGQELECAAKIENSDECAAQIERMGYYLANVKVEFNS